MPLTLSPSSLVQWCSDERDDLLPAPIPAADVLDGDPVARGRTVAQLDDGLSVWLWECTPGRFTWRFGRNDEVVHIISGSVTVTDQDGGVVHLGPGDVAMFGRHTRAVWHVHEELRKVAVNRAVPGDPLSRGARAVRSTAKRARDRWRRTAASPAAAGCVGAGTSVLDLASGWA